VKERKRGARAGMREEEKGEKERERGNRHTEKNDITQHWKCALYQSFDY